MQNKAVYYHRSHKYVVTEYLSSLSKEESVLNTPAVIN